MLLGNLPTLTQIVGYQFHFDLTPSQDIKLNDYCEKCPFRQFSVGCYHAATEASKTCRRDKDNKVVDPTDQPHPEYLPLYEKNVHRRIRPLYRHLRDSLVIELVGIPVTQIAVGSDPSLRTNGQAILHGLVVLQKIGIGSISIWIENVAPQTETQWRGLRDPRQITLTLATTDIIRNKWPLIEFVRYLLLLSHLGLSANQQTRAN
jgi:hypothetical protein